MSAETDALGILVMRLRARLDRSWRQLDDDGGEYVIFKVADYDEVRLMVTDLITKRYAEGGVF